MKHFLCVAAMCLVMVGCGEDEESTTVSTTSNITTSMTTLSTTMTSATTETTTETTTSSTTGTTPQTTGTTGTLPPPPLNYLWLGEMCGAPDGWIGTETVEISNDAGVVQCVYAWDSQSKGKPMKCSQCSFAFEVGFSNGRELSGTCAVAGLGKDAAHPIENYGYSPFFDDGKFTFKDVLLRGQIMKDGEFMWRVVGGMTAGAKKGCFEYDLL